MVQLPSSLRAAIHSKFVEQGGVPPWHCRRGFITFGAADCLVRPGIQHGVFTLQASLFKATPAGLDSTSWSKFGFAAN